MVLYLDCFKVAKKHTSVGKNGLLFGKKVTKDG